MQCVVCSVGGAANLVPVIALNFVGFWGTIVESFQFIFIVSTYIPVLALRGPMCEVLIVTVVIFFNISLICRFKKKISIIVRCGRP
jgi:hypothetical protein